MTVYSDLNNFSTEPSFPQQVSNSNYCGSYFEQPITESPEQQLLQNMNAEIPLQGVVGHNIMVKVDGFTAPAFTISTAISLPSDGVMNTFRNSEPQTIKLKGMLFLNDVDFQNVQLLLSQAAMLNVAQQINSQSQQIQQQIQNQSQQPEQPQIQSQEQSQEQEQQKQQSQGVFTEMNSFQNQKNEVEEDMEICEKENDIEDVNENIESPPNQIDIMKEEILDNGSIKPHKSSKSQEEKLRKRNRKRKYVKSGLYRKDKNGRFIFSSANRARLSVLMQNIQTDKTTGGENLEEKKVLFENENISKEIVQLNLEKEIDNADPEYFKGFEIFFREQRALLQQQQSNDSELSFDQVKKILIEQWKALPTLEKQKYKSIEEKEKKLKMSIVNNSESNENNGNEELANEYALLNLNLNMQRVKRPLNAYNIFCKLHFEEVKKKHPEHSLNKLSQIMGLKWKKMTDKEKKFYYDKVEHTPRFKKPLNSYNLFCKKHFDSLKKQYPNKSINELSKLIASKWKQLPYEEKKVYYEAAEQQKSQCGFIPMDGEQNNVEVKEENSGFIDFQNDNGLSKVQMRNIQEKKEEKKVNVQNDQNKKMRNNKREREVITKSEDKADDCLLFLNLQPLTQTSQIITKEEVAQSSDSEYDNEFLSFGDPFEEPPTKKQCLGIDFGFF